MVRMFSTLLILSLANPAMAVLSLPFADNFESETPLVTTTNYTNFNNWNITSGGGGVDLVFDPFTPVGNPGTTSGNGFFVDLVGSNPKGSINGGLQSKESFTLQTGITYALSYNYGYGAPNGAGSATMQLGFRNAGLASVISSTTQSASGFMNPNDNPGSFVYKHMGAPVSADIFFVNTSFFETSNGVLLDDVVLSVVPEPSAFLFFSLVTLGTGLVRFTSRSDADLQDS